MFEHSVISVGSRSSSVRRAAFLPLSIAIHALLIGGCLLVTLWRISFPLDVPSQLQLFRAMQPVPLPASAPPPRPVATPRPPVAAAPAPAAPAATRAASVTPAAIPDKVPAGGQTAWAVDVSPQGPAGTDVGPSGGASDGTTTAPVAVRDAGPVRVGGEVIAPLLLTRVSPSYPGVAIALRKEGEVELTCIIDRTGKVRSATVIRSDLPAFSEAAIAAVKKWQFRPGMLRGQAIDTIFDLRVAFRLDRR
jgi:protein TonB